MRGEGVEAYVTSSYCCIFRQSEKGPSDSESTATPPIPHSGPVQVRVLPIAPTAR